MVYKSFVKARSDAFIADPGSARFIVHSDLPITGTGDFGYYTTSLNSIG